MRKSERCYPRFITFEGGEGAGKTSLIGAVEKWLVEWNVTFVKTREPGGSKLGSQIRKWLLEKNSPQVGSKAELLLFLADRAQHIEEFIAPNLKRGMVVLCDRFNDSTVAYQGAARGLGIDWVQSLCDQVCGDVVPDLTFYLDVDPQIGLKRTRKASKENAAAGMFDRIETEQLEFHERVREAFASIGKKNPARLIKLDANMPKKCVFESAKKVLQERFEL